MKIYDMILWLTMRGNAIISGLSVLFTSSFLTAPKRMILKGPLGKKSVNGNAYPTVSRTFCIRLDQQRSRQQNQNDSSYPFAIVHQQNSRLFCCQTTDGSE
jgi:hypothetical protein